MDNLSGTGTITAPNDGCDVCDSYQHMRTKEGIQELWNIPHSTARYSILHIVAVTAERQVFHFLERHLTGGDSIMSFWQLVLNQETVVLAFSWELNNIPTHPILLALTDSDSSPVSVKHVLRRHRFSCSRKTKKLKTVVPAQMEYRVDAFLYVCARTVHGFTSYLQMTI